MSIETWGVSLREVCVGRGVVECGDLGSLSLREVCREGVG